MTRPPAVNLLQRFLTISKHQTWMGSALKIHMPKAASWEPSVMWEIKAGGQACTLGESSPGGSDVKFWLTVNLAHFSLEVFTAYSHGMWAWESGITENFKPHRAQWFLSCVAVSLSKSCLSLPWRLFLSPKQAPTPTWWCALKPREGRVLSWF